MIRLALRAALLRSEPYVVMVVRPDGVADGAVIVAVVHALLMIPFVLDGLGVLRAARLILSGLVGWIVLSGLVYLVGKHLLGGDGTFQGTMAATAIGFPVLLAGLVLAPFLTGAQALLILTVWLVATVWMAVRVALELPPGLAARAAIAGWAAYVVVSLLFGL